MKRSVIRVVLTVATLGAILFSTRMGLVTGHAQLSQLLNLPTWFPAVWNQSLNAPKPQQVTPGVIPAEIARFLEQADATGKVATYQPNGATPTQGNPYFTALGTNGRTCYTCHQPQSGWAMNPSSATAIFNASKGTDPLFSPVDGSNCPDLGAAASTLTDKATASSQLLTKGNIRIFLPIPANAQYSVRVVHDPYGCETSTRYGLPTGVISMYRRVLNATNLTRNAVVGPPPSAQGNIMWDGREASLESQFLDATLGHAQAATAPTSDQIEQGVKFETGLYTAQSYDKFAGSLTTLPALGGPVAISTLGIPFVPIPSVAFTQYQGWVLPANAMQASIHRGENIFNTRLFIANGVAGFNDAVVSGVNIPGALPVTCSLCHSNLNVGNDVLAGPRHLGIGDNSASDKSGYQTTATALPPTSDQPLFAFDCPVGSIPYFSNPVKINGKTYDEIQTTDPGMGLITGKCADLGKFKVPRLSGLASRAPYFHNGNAATLNDVVDFYDKRFQIGLSTQEKTDLVNFLNSL